MKKIFNILNNGIIVNNKHIGLTNNTLKIFAMIAMFLDHLGLQIFPKIYFLRVIGRLAFPIFAYMIAEGCKYTRNRTKYLGVIATFGIIFQIVYFVAMRSLYQGVLITFSLSIILIYLIDNFLKNKKVLNAIYILVVVGIILFANLYLPGVLKRFEFRIDYRIPGILMPVLIYYSKGKIMKLIMVSLMLLWLAFIVRGFQWYGFLTIPLLWLYNERRGKVNLKYMFYIFYPTHLVLIYIIDIIRHM